MKRLALIPARSGSKRIPQKNIRKFHGKPIIGYSIEAALGTKLFDRVVVSTDSEQIAEVARSFGAEVPFLRPLELSSDKALTAPVLTHALRWFEENGRLPDVFCNLLATAPFLDPEDIKRGYDLLEKEKADSVISVGEFSYPIQRSLRLNDSGRIEMRWPENHDLRSQDLERSFHDAGQFYWASSRKFLENGRMISSNTFPVVLPNERVQDIDTEEDWKFAENLYAIQH